MNQTDLTALVSSRICHDLISPIGAISNGVELMTELSRNGSTAELDLICVSASSAASKLRYFRIAFGAVPDEARVSRDEMLAAMAAMFTDRFQTELRLQADSLPRLTAKALTLTLLCLEKTLPLGGSTVIEVAGNGFSLRTEARKTRSLPELWQHVTGAPTANGVAPGDVQFLLLGDLLREHGLSFAHHIAPTEVAIDLTGVTP